MNRPLTAYPDRDFFDRFAAAGIVLRREPDEDEEDDEEEEEEEEEEQEDNDKKGRWGLFRIRDAYLPALGEA